MTSAYSRRHQEVSGELERQIVNFLEDKLCRKYHAPFDVRLPEKDEHDKDIKTVVQPDIVIICDDTKLDDKGCRGAPDIVIEILSPFTAEKDLKIKYALYEKHGVKEYWTVHPVESYINVSRLEKDKKYDKPKVYTINDKLTTSILRGLEIDLKLVFQE